jgi:hypothetical protein
MPETVAAETTVASPFADIIIMRDIRDIGRTAKSAENLS